MKSMSQSKEKASSFLKSNFQSCFRALIVVDIDIGKPGDIDKLLQKLDQLCWYRYGKYGCANLALILISSIRYRTPLHWIDAIPLVYPQWPLKAFYNLDMYCNLRKAV